MEMRTLALLGVALSLLILLPRPTNSTAASGTDLIYISSYIQFRKAKAAVEYVCKLNNWVIVCSQLCVMF